MQAVNKYLAGLDENEKLELVTKDFDFNSCKDKEMIAFVYGFNKAKVQAALEKKLAGVSSAKLTDCNQTEFGKEIVEDEIGLEINEGIILESKDNAFRVRMTMTEVFSRLLDKNRAELAGALLGGAE